jgi:acyl carrier protein
MMITNQDVVELIATSAIEVDTANLRDDVDLYGQGFDSLDMANLELRIEQRFGISIGPERSLRLRTIRDFVDFLNSEQSTSNDGH